MARVNEENARVLLGHAEQQRQHWSSIIAGLNGLAITIFVGVWSFFLGKFLDHTSTLTAGATLEPQRYAFSYIVFAAGLSAVVLALWRLYVRYLDNIIASLYPEILAYQQVLSTPIQAGILRYLLRERNIGKYLANKTPENQLIIVRCLVKKRIAGRRGHLYIDVGVFVLDFIFVVLMLFDIWNLTAIWFLGFPPYIHELSAYPILFASIFGYVLIGIGIGLQTYSFFHFQRNTPTKHDVHPRNSH